jgi:hypothetical protein
MKFFGERFENLRSPECFLSILILYLVIIIVSGSVGQMQSDDTTMISSEKLMAYNLSSISSQNKSVDLRNSAMKIISVPNIENESGQVCSNRSVSHNLLIGKRGNTRSQAFLSFDLSNISEGSIIQSATIDFRGAMVEGDPFHNLGCLKAYPAAYSSIGSGSYYSGLSYGGIVRICSLDDLFALDSYPDLVGSIQKMVGSSRFQLRLQFDEKVAEAMRTYVSKDLASWGSGGKGDSSLESGSWEEGVSKCLGENPFSNTPSTGEPPQGSLNDFIRLNNVRLDITYQPPS